MQGQDYFVQRISFGGADLKHASRAHGDPELAWQWLVSFANSPPPPPFRRPDRDASGQLFIAVHRNQCFARFLCRNPAKA